MDAWLNKWEPVLSLLAGVIGICLDRWVEHNDWFFYGGLAVILGEIFRLGARIRSGRLAPAGD